MNAETLAPRSTANERGMPGRRSRFAPADSAVEGCASRHRASILNIMEKPTDPAHAEQYRRIAFADMESGVTAGLWYVPVAGFSWHDDVRPLVQDGELDYDNPRDPGPWLVPSGDEARGYPPLRRAGLLEAFDTASNAPDADRILRFAEVYGHLGIPETLIPVKPTGNGGRALVGGRTTWGESVGMWRGELLAWRDLRLLARAVYVLGHPDSSTSHQLGKARLHISQRVRWDSRGGCSYHSRIEYLKFWSQWNERIYHPDDRDAEAVRQHLKGHDNYEAARLHLHRRVNKALEGVVNAAVLPYLDGEIRFFPASLLATLYMRFARELGGRRGSQRECEHCGRVFEARRRDQRFCNRNCQEASAYRRRVARN